MLAAKDEAILELAASTGRIVLTHDRQTMPKYAFDRVRAGLPMPGVVVVNKRVSVGAAVHALQLFLDCSSQEEWKDQVVFLPYA